MLFLALIQAANLVELPDARQGPRCVIGQSLQGTQIESIGIDRRTRGHLKRAQYLRAHQRKYDLTPNSRQGHRGRFAARVESGVRHDERATRAHDDGQNVFAVQGPHR